MEDHLDSTDDIPTPWPGLTELAEISHRRKIGVVAQRGSREARVGRDVAVHAARAGIPTLLYTGYPPHKIPEYLVVDETPRPTASQVTAAAQRRIDGQPTQLVVIERYERLAPEP
ncbi:hypothetical protein, partial [Streptomyces alkaliterrae]